MTELLWFGISVLATWQITEILHHSRAGKPWRDWSDKLASEELVNEPEVNWTEYLGLGMKCTFCYSNWIGIVCMSWTFFVYSFIPAVFMAFIGGLAAARAANWLNDIWHDITRTPNHNSNSKSAKVFREAQENEEEEDEEEDEEG